MQTRRGFTLIELLVVVGVISIVVSILLPAVSKIRQSALQVSCLANMRKSSPQHRCNMRRTMPPNCPIAIGPVVVPTGTAAYISSDGSLVGPNFRSRLLLETSIGVAPTIRPTES